MSAIKLIIFDIDGTLVDSAGDIVNSINFTLNVLGLPKKHTEEAKKCIGLGGDSLIRMALGEEHLDKLEEAHSIFSEHYSRNMFSTTKLYEGTEDVLGYFAGVKKSVVSNRNGSSIRRILEKFGIEKHFDMVLGGDEVLEMKPSALPIVKTISNLGVSKRETIIVGDMQVDVESGKAAGIFTCGATYGIGDRRDIINAKPDFLIGDIRELKTVVSEI